VQVVHVLRHHEQLGTQLGLEARERVVRSIRDRGCRPSPPRVVEPLHGLGITHERLGRRDILDGMTLPQAPGVAERGEPGFGGDARAGEDDDAHGLVGS
jgi:hypothetical protein